MFIGRQKELAYLNQFYAKSGFGMTVVYGRRRIGKSTLISKFIEDKNSIFYTATKVGNQRNIELFAKEVCDYFKTSNEGITFNTLEAVLDLISNRIQNKKLIIVIDEFPYWANNNESLLSILQKYIDTKWNKTNIKLILCGSSLSFMEDKVLSEKSPLFGRRDSQIKLDVFNYLDAAKFVSKYTPEEKAIVYGVSGGVAKYLSLFDPNDTLDNNIINLFFKPNGYLYDETQNLLRQEFSDISVVSRIIEVIANGENTINLISNKTNISESNVVYTLDKLIGVGIVEKKKCVFEEKNKKKTQYVLKDYMFKFYYQFIPSAISAIEIGHGDIFYKNIVKKQLHSFMGPVFEEICKYYTLENSLNGKYNCLATNASSWWGVEIIKDNGIKRSQPTDIDIVATAANNQIIVGECKFRKEKVDKEVYEQLVNRTKLLPEKYNIVNYLLFSLSGFSSWYDNQSISNLKLITINDLYTHKAEKP